MTEEDKEVLRELVSLKLTAAQKLIEDGPITDKTLDKAEFILNEVAKLARERSLSNYSKKYRRVSSMVAQARILWNTKNRHIEVSE